MCAFFFLARNLKRGLHSVKMWHQPLEPPAGPGIPSIWQEDKRIPDETDLIGGPVLAALKHAPPPRAYRSLPHEAWFMGDVCPPSKTQQTGKGPEHRGLEQGGAGAGTPSVFCQQPDKMRKGRACREEPVTPTESLLRPQCWPPGHKSASFEK